MPLEFTTDRGDARLRLDQVLVRRGAGQVRLSRARVQHWIAGGLVCVDGRRVLRPAARVREGVRVVVDLPDAAPRRARPEPEPGALAILYEDDHLIVVDKPPGVVVHPSYRQSGGTLLNAVLWHLRGRPDATPGIVTRLDKDTSGVVIIALHARTHAGLQREAAAGRVSKEYLAVVARVPRPASGRIVLPLGHDPRDRRRIVVTPDGARAETRYEVLATSADARPEPGDARACASRVREASVPRRRRIALVRCELVTGRTHQIRVHLASRGWPILGDRAYGEAHPAFRRQALHAWRVTFSHPITRETVTCVAPLPPDLAAADAWTGGR